MKKYLVYFISPSAIGIYVTLVVVLLAFIYYTTAPAEFRGAGRSGFFSILKLMDEKSADLRLKSRGPKTGSGQVALLTVDEFAVRSIGRWPWPRQVTARAIENAVKLGAKVIAFDVVFGEPSELPLKKFYDNIKQKTPLPESLDAEFQQALHVQDSDLQLSQTISRTSDRLVLGSFFENRARFPEEPGYWAYCHHLMFKQSEAFPLWDKEEVLISASDSNDLYVPETISEFYRSYFGMIAQSIREAHPPVRNSQDREELNLKIQEAQSKFCMQEWLDPEKDPSYQAISEAWPLIREKEGADFAFESFPQWIDHFVGSSLTNTVEEARLWVMNTPQISEHIKHTGYFNAVLDTDGTIRRSKLIARSGNFYMPSIALKAYLVAHNYNAEVVIQQDIKNPNTKHVEELRITNNETGDVVQSIPVDSEGNLSINYAGPEKMYPHVSLAHMLSDKADMNIEQMVFNPETKRYETLEQRVNKAQFMKDKLFIFGATAIGIFDLRVTPFQENFPGAETHANVLDNLLTRNFLYTHKDEPVKMLGALFLGGLFLSLFLGQLGAVSGLAITISAMTLALLGDSHFLFSKGIVVSIIFPLFLILSVYVSMTFYKYFTEERNKKELRATFQKYVSPAIVDEILSHPDNIELGGRKEVITVFFSDVRGFTTISEKLDPRKLSDLLNSYLTPMTELVFKNRGTLDKYMGDAIMAFFGAPIPYPEHAKFACRCALQQLEKLKELQAQYKKMGLPNIDIGIGLNTGECSVGNMGSETVRNYTVMGDSVNLGSRLEGINKEYGTRIIISEYTHAHVKDDFLCREVDWVRVKGKIHPVKIFELLAEGKLATDTLDLLKYFGEGYHLYHARKFKEAREIFGRSLSFKPDDGPAQLYVERCEEFIEAPPPENWDGVFIMKTK